tara:strand:+ start:1582 stop:2466 length:885 start_codon:yes stop_codon:yes gene_type:complete
MNKNKYDAILSKYSTLIIFIIPALTIFTLFVVLPIVEAAYYSFYRWDGYGEPNKYVGLKNYQYLFKNKTFILSLQNNFYIIAVSLFIQLPFALLVALLISDKIRGASFFRTVFFLPYILAEIVTALIWAYIYDGNYGMVAAIWNFFGAKPPYLISEKDTAMMAILIVIFWKYFGIHMMIYIAGLQNISKEVLEAAKVDGAGPITTAIRIKIPILLPTIRLSVFLSLLGSLQLFDLIMPLTGGGPSNQTHSMVTYLYYFGVMRMKFGFGSAIGVVIFLICFTVAITYQRTLMRKD